MCKKHILLIVPLVALIAIGIFSGDVHSDIAGLQGHYKDLGGPGGNVSDCNICHDFAGGYYNNPASGNLRWVKPSIKFCSTSTTVACNIDSDCPTGETCGPSSRTVKFIRFAAPPADGTLADGPAPYDGACEVCHTKTNYHTYNGYKQDGVTPVDPHYDGLDCTGCHPHFRQNMLNYFEPAFSGSQSHITHWTDPKGPQLGSDNCTYCHNANHFYLFADGKNFAETTVCNPCHSEDGSFHGVSDPVIGAKANWVDGIYTAQGLVKEGKENWCAGCHDNGTSVIKGVSAPNVMGNNSTYGYNISGHGRNPLDYIRCDDCHDTSVLHTDGKPRTYSASQNNYKAGYRLILGLTIPRNGQYGQNAFKLCFDCHVYSEVTGYSVNGQTSNFRNDNAGLNLHNTHIGSQYASIICWDSDWDGLTFPDLCYVGSECQDSAMSCTACHNVHGSPMTISSTYYPNPKMIRHGELISTPGTTDAVPALDFRWYTSESVPTTDFILSRWGGMTVGGMDNQRIDVNHVCWGCHAKGENRYYRVPSGLTESVKINNVWTTDLSNTGKTLFARGEGIRYHVSYTVSGPATTYNLKSNGNAKNTSGSAWSTTLSVISRTANAGIYSETWDSTIPSGATSGSSAKVTVTVKMRYTPSGTVISQDSKTSTFRIQ